MLSTFPRKTRAAFTLVELLVVIAIIGILVALLLPAVQAAREAGRRMACGNNIKQLGLGLHNYHDTYKKFPPAGTWLPNSSPGNQNQDKFGPSWAILLLPYIEQQSVYDAFTLTQPINAAVNRDARGVELDIMLCATDSNYNRKKYGRLSGGSNGHVSAHGDNWARGNYAVNAGLGFFGNAHCNDYGANGWGCTPSASQSNGWGSGFARGVMATDSTTAIKDIKDGTSNTFMILETRAGVTNNDCRGVWAMLGAGPSAMAAHGYLGDAWGPNSGVRDSDDTAGCADIITVAGGVQRLRDIGMSCYSGTSSWPNRQASPRSSHIGGIQVCFVDGSVHYIGDYIESKGSASGGAPTHYSVWDRLNLSSDEQPVSPKQY